MSAATFLNIPVFAGQGAAAADYPAFRKQAQRDATSSAGSLLLTACFEAFHAELSCLAQDEILRTGIDLSDFKHRNAILDIPPDCYLSNPILTGTTLFLFQSLRYLAYIETSGGVEETLAPFSDVLKGNREYQLGVLGFSSGILPAVVVATSFNTISYISRSVEAYRLAFWIGVRVQQFREKIALHNPDSPWSLVFSGLDKKSAEEAIIAFDSVHIPCLFHRTNYKLTSLTIGFALGCDSGSGRQVCHYFWSSRRFGGLQPHNALLGGYPQDYRELFIPLSSSFSYSPTTLVRCRHSWHRVSQLCRY